VFVQSQLLCSGGPIDSNFNFVIGGPAVATTLAKSTFLDTCTWDGGKLRVDKLRTPDKSYEIRTLRWLEDDGNTIHCVSRRSLCSTVRDNVLICTC
jgi:hypothetical protein